MGQFYSLSDYYLKTFGTKVYKVTLATPTTCPNRDGTVDSEGCHFCDRFGSKSYYPQRSFKITEQAENTIPHLKARFGAKKFIAYLQSYTNTYGPISFLRKIFEQALSLPDIVGLDIGTRPDCLPDAVCDLLAEFSEKTHVTVELGVQSFREQTVKWMNRAHTSAQSLDAILKLQERAPKVHINAHFIFGSPGETDLDLRINAAYVNRLGIHSVKLHQLHIFKQTELELAHYHDPIPLFEMRDYTEKMRLFLGLLNPDICVHRTHGVAARHDELVGPEWTKEKLSARNILLNEINFSQGDLLGTPLEYIITKDPQGYPSILNPQRNQPQVFVPEPEAGSPVRPKAIIQAQIQ